MKKIIMAICILSIGLNAIAQDSATVKAPSIGIKLGLLDFKKTNQTEGLTKSAVNFGLQYLQGISKHIDFVTNLDFASLKYPYYTSLKVPAASKNQDYMALDFNLNYKFLTDNHPVVPYLTGGIGVGADHFSYYSAYVPIGGGLQIKANQGSFVMVQATYRAEASSLTKMHNAYSIAYTLPLKLKNKKPVMLPPAPVALDGDNDGVVDSLDKCPNQAGIAKYNGCPIPDTDNDGVNDELDKCPNQAGVAKYNGCPIPDSDHDGINDEQDKCPNQAGLSRYQGCPIPDTDKDGVNDEEDLCPTEAGIAANHGCADLQPILDLAASKLKFATGKIYLSKAQLVGLDKVVEALNKFPNTTLDISGHTDNTGAERINKKLSHQRAAVVYNYLAKKGIAKTRLTKDGFAATRPIADNKTKAGRAANRRADLGIKY